MWKNKASYANGVDSPNGASRPSARALSNVLFGRSDDTNTGGPSAMLIYFGQLLAHDISLTGGSSVDSDVWPIQVPECDPYFDPSCTGTATIGFTRTAWDSSTGTDTSNPRQQINGQTSFLDASHVYGETDERANALRTFVDGKLLVDEHNLLPSTPNTAPSCTTNVELH